MLINQIGVEEEPTVVALRSRRSGESPGVARESLTDLLGAVWSVGLVGPPDEGGPTGVTTLVSPEAGAASTSEPRRADVA